MNSEKKQMTPEALTFRDVSVRFCGHTVQAVDGVSFTAPAGRRTVIIGETGSGKSVLLLAVLGLLPADAQVSGRIQLGTTELEACSEEQLRQVRGSRIGYVPQGGGGSMNPVLTVGYQVAEPMMLHRGLGRKKALALGASLMERFGIAQAAVRAKGFPHEFSGGMRQRAMLAMGLSAGAGVLLADEPTKGLDAANIARVGESFRQLQQTLLCVTHDLRFAQQVAQQVVVMYAAQVLEISPADRFFEQPLHPYSQALLCALPERGLVAAMGFAPEHAEQEQIGCRFCLRCPYADRRCSDQRPPMLEQPDGRKVRCWRYA